MNPTLKYALTYGGLAGLVIIAAMAVILATGVHSLWLGYFVMLVALTFVFVGVKRYRDVELGGVIKFGRAFALGLAIAIAAGLAYVATWEAYLAATGYDFMNSYIASVLAEKRAAGVSGAALAAEAAKLEALRVQYANPLYRLPMTFMEIFPVRLVVALISAALLRNPRLLPAR